MRLHEIRKLPEKAGIARIRFASYNSRPRIKGNEIRLPKDIGDEYFALSGGDKFLFVDNFATESHFWFGGTDSQSAFLVCITPEAFEAFEERGEQGFFEYLKPARIKSLEKLWEVKAKRQGDIWYLRYPLSLKIALSLREVYGYEEMEEVESFSVFGTSHRLSGRYCASSDDLIVCTGTLTAPNHPKALLRGLNILMQNNGLYNPIAAD